MIYQTTAYGAKCDVCQRDYLDQFATGYQPTEEGMRGMLVLGHWRVTLSGYVVCSKCVAASEL